MRPGTTLCIPAWNGAAFVAETLAAAARQDVPDLVVHISVDGGDSATAEACAPFLADSRFRLTVQPQRLGWVGNTNWLFARAQTRFVAILPHDDLPEPGWLNALHAALAAAPHAVCSFADLQGFGGYMRRINQSEVRGATLTRLLDTLLHQRPAVAYRGLFRCLHADDMPFLPTSLPGDVAADTAWLMELACRGELRRVPEVLVRKRYHAGNTHSAWDTQPLAAKVQTQGALAGWMTRRALATVGEDPAFRSAVVAAALLRLAGCGAGLPGSHRLPVSDLLVAFGAACPEASLALPRPPIGPLLAEPDAAPLRNLLTGPASSARLSAVRDTGTDGMDPNFATALSTLAAAAAPASS